MADCGASGSALDRAASAAASAVGGNANPQIRAAASAMSSLMGNTASSASVAGMGMLPAAAPDRIALASPAASAMAMAPATAAGSGIAGAPVAAHHSVAMQQIRQRNMVGAAAPLQVMAARTHQQHRPAANLYAARHHGVMQQHAQAQRHAEMQQQQQMMMQQQQRQHQMMVQHAQMQQMTMMQQQQIMHMQQQQQRQRQQQQQQQNSAAKQAAAVKDDAQTASAATARVDATASSSRERDMDEAWRDAAADVDDAVNVASAVNVAERPDLNSWHEGLEEEAAEALRDGGELYGDDRDVAKGASIEELAAAWAEAERSSEHDVHRATNGASAEEYVVSEASKRLAEESVAAHSSAPSSTDFMERGNRHFRNGALLDAITCFEAEIHLRPDNAVAWTMLGKCHAENDMDRNAIACLERAIDADPYQLDALLSLGVSYVNELDSEKALHNLRAWVEHNPTYAGLEVQDDGCGDGTPLDDVQNLLLQALEFRPDDADAREALGVCYNVSQEYEAAVESLRTALSSRPAADDGNYQLWNKLGATLANGGRSEEALPAYHRAIEAKPRYARAWLNMAISHGNLQNYREAARCYLQTLSLNPNAVHCWSYLRIALTCLEDWDLLTLATSQNLTAFHEHFDFVEY